MTTENLLAKLRDIRLPEPPPSEPVWDIWLAATLIAIALGLFLFSAYRRKRSFQREALREVNRIDCSDARRARVELADLTRRIAIGLSDSDNAPRIAHLTGDAYLLSLDQIFQNDFFTTGDGQAFGNALYQPTDEHIDQKISITRLRDGLRKAIRGIETGTGASRHADRITPVPDGVRQA